MKMGESKSMSFASRNSARWRNNPFYKWHKSLKEERNRSISSFLTKESKSVDYDYSFKENDELNPTIWNEDGKMKPEIRKDLLDIAKEFYQYLDITTPIEDILVVGSNANYNYTDQSDIDLHLVIDLSKLGSNKSLIADFMDVKKAYWGLTHDIKIKDHDVESYVQDTDDDVKSGGIYSVKNDKWIKEPKKNKIDINKNLVRKKVDYLAALIDDLSDLTDDNEKKVEAERIKNKIKKMRTSGLEKGGEFSEDNLTFKVLRNTGYLDKLRKIKNKAVDDALTIKESFIKTEEDMLEEKAVSEKQRNFFGIVRALQKGEIKPSKVSEKVKKAAKGMSQKSVEDYASTKDSELKEEVVNHKFEYGCLMNYFDIPTWDEKILSKINKDDLYEDEPGFGLETEPHVTVLFGFHPESTDVQEMMEIVNEYVQEKPIKIEVKKVSHFPSEKFDVLKFDVESPELRELNNIMKERFDYTSNFPDYHPHMTIAYLKKGMANKYEKDFRPGAIILNGDDFVYSDTDGTQTIWNPMEKDVKKTIEFKGDNGINKLTIVKGDMDATKVNFIKDFIQFVCDNLHMENPVHVFLRNGRDEYIRSTASYVPDENTNHINVKKRSLVDILRSIAHELTHNRQREIGKILPDVPVPNIGGEIENEADSVAGMLIKHYTHTCGLDEVYDL